ncbi:MAG: Holliday junction branch migration DNA helicase RuvB [Planctomycetes bacterium]|nr:Holliday junction branch migration DNA helicase RuvB [Planctomycetota bacterium]
MSEPDIHSGFRQDDERRFETIVRPQNFVQFVGRPDTVSNLKTWIQGATLRNEPLDHILFSGPPGLGKTTLAYIIANELGVNIKTTSGPALVRPKDLVGLLTNLGAADVLFIDEIHRMDVRVEEYLYSAMEDFFISIIIDPGPHGRSIKIDLKPFTLIGATTREGLLAPPLRSRFQILEKLDFYTPEELARIIKNSARILNIGIRDDAADLIAARSRGTPRVANRLLRRIRDVAQAGERDVITKAVAEEGLARLGVDEIGLGEMDRKILLALARNTRRPVGLKTIAAVVGEEEGTIRDVYEPFLIRHGLLERTARGREITPAGLKAIRDYVDGPQVEQNGLF